MTDPILDAEEKLVNVARDATRDIMEGLIACLSMLPKKEGTSATLFATTMIARDCLIQALSTHRNHADPDWEATILSEGKRRDCDIVSEEDIVYWALFSAISLHFQDVSKMKARIEGLFRRLYGHDYQWRVTDSKCEHDKEEIARRRARRTALRPTHEGTKKRQ